MPSDRLRWKIHSTFRLGYIKDAILPRVLDDVTFAALHSMMLFNHIEILTDLQQDPAFFRDLFARLRAGDASSEYWASLVAFVQELAQLATHPQYSTCAGLEGAGARLSCRRCTERPRSGRTAVRPLRTTCAHLRPHHARPRSLRLAASAVLPAHLARAPPPRPTGARSCTSSWSRRACWTC